MPRRKPKPYARAGSSTLACRDWWIASSATPWPVDRSAHARRATTAAHAVVDLRPRPPDARRGEGLVRPGAEVVADAGEAAGGLDRLEPAVGQRDAVPGLELVPLAAQPGHGLLRVLDDRREAVPL